MEIKAMIRQFQAHQIESFGYERFKVRKDSKSPGLEYSLDVYTRSGLVIKTKLSHLSEEKIITVMNEFMMERV